MDNSIIKEKKKTLGFIVGLIIIIFAVLGILGLVLAGISAIKSGKAEKQRARYAEYNRFLIPAAAIDIKPFDDISHALMSELVEMSVWSILNTDLDPSEYEYADGRLLMPSELVEKEFADFFGPELRIEHMTVEGYGYEFTYDAVNGVYYIPLTTITPIYTPVISEVEKKGASLTITCGLTNASLWAQDKLTGEMKAPLPDKYIKVTLHSIGKNMYISAIQFSGAPETASTEASQTREDTSVSVPTEEESASGTDETTTKSDADNK